MTKKRVAAIFIAPLIGAVLGYLLVYALSNGWFSSKWQRIEKPPGDEIQLVALSLDSLWVQDASGTTYYNQNASTCASDCWKEVSEIPALPVVTSDETTVIAEACAPSPPLIGIKQSISECHRTMWVDYTFTFALRRDGSIYLWQADLFKEWSFVLLIGGVCIGAIVLFIPVLVVVLVLWLRDRGTRRANSSPVS